MKRRRPTPFKWDAGVSGGGGGDGGSGNWDNRNNARVWSSSSDDNDDFSDTDDDIPINDEAFNRVNMINELLGSMKSTNPSKPTDTSQPKQQPKKQQQNGSSVITKIVIEPKPKLPLADVFIPFSNAIMNKRIMPEWSDDESSSSSSSSSEDSQNSDEDDNNDDGNNMDDLSKSLSSALTKYNKNPQISISRDKANIFDNIFEGLTGNRNTNTKSKTHSKAGKNGKYSSCPKCHKRKKKKAKQEYDRRTRGECFLCAWGNLYHDGIEAKCVAKMNKIMDNYGGCDNIELAQQLVLYYKRFVYKKDKGLPMFTVQIALEHIEHHILSAKIYAGESIRMWLQIRYVIANNLFDENGKHDRHDLNGLINVQKLLNTCYGLDPAKLLFNFGDSADDMKKIGQNFKFFEFFKQRDDRIDNRMGRAFNNNIKDKSHKKNGDKKTKKKSSKTKMKFTTTTTKRNKKKSAKYDDSDDSVDSQSLEEFDV